MIDGYLAATLKPLYAALARAFELAWVVKDTGVISARI